MDLSPYSPHLNFIERLWKLLKRLARSARVLPTFEDFEASLHKTIDRLETDHREEIASILTPNFQTFDEAQIRSA